MGYFLQYQAHVDDLTSLAGSPADTSWFVLHPHEAPRAPILLAEGFFAADLHSEAGEADDVSWFTTFADKAPVERVLLPVGFFAGDIDSASAIVYGLLLGVLEYVAATMPGNHYFKVYYRATAGTVYARLYDITASAEVAGSLLSTAETTFQLERTDALALIDGHLYEGQFGTVGADAGGVRMAKVPRVT